MSENKHSSSAGWEPREGVVDKVDIVGLEEDKREPLIESTAATTSTVSAEAKRLLRLSIPLSAQNLLYIAFGLISSGYVGRLGAVELASSVLAMSIFNVTGSSLVFGLASGLETLCGQAYGARNYRQVGVVLQRALLINLLGTSLVVGLLWTQIEHVLLALGQNEELTRSASRYLRLCSPALLCQAVDSALARYLMLQGVVRPQFVSACCGSLLAPVLLWVMVIRLELGLDGAAIAFSLNSCVMLAVDVLVVVLREVWLLRDAPNKCWHGWSWDAWRQWDQYLRYAIPSYFMISLEWWLYEILAVMTGLLPNPSLALSTMGIVFNVISLVYMIPLGMADGVITRVSNELGAQQPMAARKAAWTGVLLALVSQSTMSVVSLALRPVLGRIWSNQEEVVASVAHVVLPLAVTMLGDGVSCVLAGVLRTSGQQVLGVCINVCTYWLCGMPLATLLGLKWGLGVVGMWEALAAITFLQMCVLLVVLYRMDWQRLATEAADRVQQMGTNPESPAELPLLDPLLAS